MNIAKATMHDLSKLQNCAQRFYASSRFLTKFDMARFVKIWAGLLESESGVIFLLLDNGQNAVGALGGVAYPDIYSGEMIASEMYWFVMPEYRGGGIRLYRAFEEWAKEQECLQVRMVHLLDSMPEKLERVYRHFGFTPAEVHYVKDLEPRSIEEVA
jgi:GNAT superfamily N-acetyltransferase